MPGNEIGKKERGGLMLTPDKVKAWAEERRRKRAEAQDEPEAAGRVETAEPPEDAPLWRPGPPPEISAEEMAAMGDEVTATAVRRYFNRHLLGCEIEGEAQIVQVRVRDEKNYRNGEQFLVKKNDRGEWEAVAHRSSPRYR